MRLAIFFALGVGLTMSVHMLVAKYTMRQFNFTPRQLNYDATLLQGFLCIPFWVCQSNYYGGYSLIDICVSSFATILANMGSIFITSGIQCGQAGVVQAIDNLKGLWLTILVAIFKTGQWPSE
jgi:hypothetical protein